MARIIVTSKVKALDQDHLEIRDGGGCLMLFGLPFALGGVLMILAALGKLPGGEPVSEPNVMLGMSLAFLLPGLGMMGGRKWTVLDLAQGVVSMRWGWFVPIGNQVRPLSDFCGVVMRFSISSGSGDSGSAEEYPVALKAVQGKDLPLCTMATYADALRRAKEFAAFLRYPLLDDTTQHEQVIAPEHLGESFQTQLVAEEATAPAVAPPPELRSQVSVVGDAVQIRIPGRGFPPVLRLLVGAVVVFILLFEIPFLSPLLSIAHDSGMARLFFGGFMLLSILGPLIVLGAVFYRMFYSRTTVTVNSQGIVIANQAIVGKTTRTIPAADILGLDYKQAAVTPSDSANTSSSAVYWIGTLLSSGGITVKTTAGLQSFGAGLSDEETLYLFALIKEALSGKVRV